MISSTWIMPRVSDSQASSTWLLHLAVESVLQEVSWDSQEPAHSTITTLTTGQALSSMMDSSTNLPFHLKSSPSIMLIHQPRVSSPLETTTLAITTTMML